MFNTNAWNRIRYTIWAPGYNLIAGAFAKKRRRSIELARIEPGDRVLLVGAGTGLDLDFLPREARIVAVDLTPAMLNKLRRRAERLGLSVDARVMDAQALEFVDNFFDVVVLHLIVAVIPDPVRCVREAARVLRPGGRAVILDKFVPDEGPAPLAARLLNPFTRIVATEFTRRLGSILAGSGLRHVHEEAVGFGGLLKIVVVEKCS